MKQCQITHLGKHRNGSPKYWCKTHYAKALVGEDESIPSKCTRWSRKPIEEKDILYIDSSDWEGGVGIWGSLDAVYNTSKWSGHTSGIHVHARSDENQEKHIDRTFQKVFVKVPNVTLFDEKKNIKLTTEIACAYTASMVFGKNMKYLECSHCGKPHIDAGYFAVTYHQKHMCTYCGREFRDDSKGISNPVIEIQRIFKSTIESRTISLVNRELNIKQSDYAGGIEIWGSNPAIIWTAERDEESGIHVHAYKDVKENKPCIDETFGRVIIDSIELDGAQIRSLMVQQSLEHLEGRVKLIKCPECKEPHFDRQDNGVRPHMNHLCEFCDTEFSTPTKCVGNPILEKLELLRLNFQGTQK